jgi:hypothetical protein
MNALSAVPLASPHRDLRPRSRRSVRRRAPSIVVGGPLLVAVLLLLLPTALGFSAGSAANSPTATPTALDPAVGGTAFQETFNESGLPNVTVWFVNVAAVGVPGYTQYALNGTSVPVTFPDGNYTFSVDLISGYAASPASGSFNSTTNTSETIGFTPGGYAVTFYESGLNSGTYWTVSVDYSAAGYGTTASSITWVLANGTYSAQVGGAVGYSPNPAAFNFTVSGGGRGFNVTFANASWSAGFVETGLTTGTNWSVTASSGLGTWVGQGTGGGSPIQIFLPNGSYSFAVSSAGAFAPAPANGSFTVSGASVRIPISFTPVGRAYPLDFIETGLPSGSTWGVSVNGSAQSMTTGTSILWYEANGTWPYSVGGPSGYVAAPSSGTATVAGQPVNVTIAFSPTPPPRFYRVAFTETGLPVGAVWSVTLGGGGAGMNGSSTNATVPFNLDNGTYGYTVAGPAGYAATPANGSVVVAGGPVAVSVTFASVNSTPATYYQVLLTESGLPVGTNWGATLGGAMAASTNSTLGFSDVNGTYVLTVPSVGNYSANYSSPVVVNGASVNVSVTFTNATNTSNSSYPVQFRESGLPASTEWTVSATNVATQQVTTGRSTGPSLTLHLAAGTYDLAASGPSGYRVTFAPSVLTVSATGTPSPLATFETTVPSAITPASLPWATVGVLVVTGIVGVVGAGWGYGRIQYARRREVAERWFQEFRATPGEQDETPK